MTESEAARTPDTDDEISILAVAAAILRHWRLILAVMIVGGIAGAMYGYSKPELYESTSIFVPQGSEGAGSGLAAQFGIRLPSAGGAWGPPMYVELIRTRDMLAPLIHDTVGVPEDSSRREPLMKLLQVSGETPERTIRNGVNAISAMIDVSEAKKVFGVQLTVKSKWPSVSYAMNLRLLDRINQFNIETRKSHAAIERQYVETQAHDAEQGLRDAEEKQKQFLQHNRAGLDQSPELRADNDRLQRDVNRLSQLYLARMQNLDEARALEVRDTPVINLLEAPQMPVEPALRPIERTVISAAIAAGVFAVFLVLFIEGWRTARRSQNPELRDFLNALNDALPRFLRRRTA